ncbi:hypothetical protein [Streptomyces sp. P17]|uniref:hypothetical protein n=1 Tax=Streptomyces sp. P17 TaxID=3074716 RepID=UPI0037DDE1E6
MSATVEAAPAKDAAGPIRPPGTVVPGRAREGFATFFGALGPLCCATRRVRRHATLTDAERERIVERADARRDSETDGISLDLIPRDRSAPYGVMELMAAELCAAGPRLGIRRWFVSVPSQRKLRGNGHPKGGPRPASTAALPSLTALGLDGGDEAGRAGPDADLPEQVRVRYRERERPRADGAGPYLVGIAFVRLRDRSGGHQLAPPLTYPGCDPADGPSWAGWVESCRR